MPGSQLRHSALPSAGLCFPAEQMLQTVAAVEKQIRTAPNAPVPLVIRNAPTGMMKDQGNGDGYIYPPDHGYPVKPQAYLPDELVGTRFLPNERQCPMIARALARCADAPDSVLDGHLT